MSVGPLEQAAQADASGMLRRAQLTELSTISTMRRRALGAIVVSLCSTHCFPALTTNSTTTFGTAICGRSPTMSDIGRTARCDSHSYRKIPISLSELMRSLCSWERSPDALAIPAVVKRLIDAVMS